MTDTAIIRIAPRTVHAFAGYIVETWTGHESEYVKVGDPTITDTLGWSFWPDTLPHGRGAILADETYAEYSTREGGRPKNADWRYGLVRADLTVPEGVRQKFAAAASLEEATSELNDWVDTIEWDESWDHGAVTIVRMSDAFSENRDRIRRRRAERNAPALAQCA